MEYQVHCPKKQETKLVSEPDELHCPLCHRPYGDGHGNTCPYTISKVGRRAIPAQAATEAES